ncbi:MAG: glycosyltransferase family 4 protein [Deltaproteobacteria bacterium]|nr:glycosyltransferase family 4 protein [Deltaproteobacteria bacterium]
MTSSVLRNPGWIVQAPNQLPDEKLPYGGIFTEAHIESVIPFIGDQVVYYAYALPPETLKGLPAKEDLVQPAKHGVGRYRKIIRRYVKRQGWQARGFVDFVAWVTAHRRRIRLLHAHGTVWAGIWSVAAGNIFRIPVLLSEYSSGYPQRTYPWAFRRIFPVVLPKLSAILPVTENLGSFIREYAPTVPQHVVQNCIDTEFFKPSPLPPADPARILYVGSLEPVKRVDLLLKSCARLAERRNVRARLGGIGPLAESMRDLAASLGLASKVEFLGYLSREQVRDEMARCHVLVLSSEWESQPCVLIEAMLSGRPVVAPRVGGAPEMVTEQTGRLFEVGNEDELAQALETVLDNYSSWQPQAIAETCRDRYSYETVGRLLAQLYQQYAAPERLWTGA